MSFEHYSCQKGTSPNFQYLSDHMSSWLKFAFSMGMHFNWSYLKLSSFDFGIAATTYTTTVSKITVVKAIIVKGSLR